MAGEILRGNAIPHPDTPIDLVVRIHELESQEIVAEFDESGTGENEQFAFTLPDDGSGNLLTFIVSVEDADRHKGAYMFVTSPALSPEGVVLSIFEAARTGDFTGLAGLCDPLGENDGDTQMICDLATDDTNREEFIAAFSTGTVIGDAVVALSGDRAEVPFLFGPDGDEEETMELVKRNDRWYLLGF